MKLNDWFSIGIGIIGAGAIALLFSNNIIFQGQTFVTNPTKASPKARHARVVRERNPLHRDSPHPPQGYTYTGPWTRDEWGNPMVPEQNRKYSNCYYSVKEETGAGVPKVDTDCLRSEMIRASEEAGPCDGLTKADVAEIVSKMIPVSEAIGRLREAVGSAAGAASAYAYAFPATATTTTTAFEPEPLTAREHEIADPKLPKRPMAEAMADAEGMLMEAANQPYTPELCGVWKPGYVQPETILESITGSGMVGGETASRPEWYHKLGDWAGVQTRPIVSRYPRPYRPYVSGKFPGTGGPEEGPSRPPGWFQQKQAEALAKVAARTRALGGAALYGSSFRRRRQGGA